MPSNLTIKGHLSALPFVASTIPSATKSHLVMPPKILIKTLVTSSSDSKTSKAAVTVSAFAPPPISQKFAAFPPCSATTSRVDITNPAPLPIIPTLPSNLIKFKPLLLANFSDSGMGISSSYFLKSSCR